MCTSRRTIAAKQCVVNRHLCFVPLPERDTIVPLCFILRWKVVKHAVCQSKVQKCTAAPDLHKHQPGSPSHPHQPRNDKTTSTDMASVRSANMDLCLCLCFGTNMKTALRIISCSQTFLRNIKLTDVLV